MTKHPKIPRIWSEKRPTEPGWYWLNKGKGIEPVYVLWHPHPEEQGELLFIKMNFTNPIRQHAIAFLGWDWLPLEAPPVKVQPKPTVKPRKEARGRRGGRGRK